MKNLLLIFVSMLFFYSCNEGRFEGKYLIHENYEVFAGELTGMKSSSEYSIEVVRVDDEFIVKNFANAYDVHFIVKGDSINIPAQKFPYNQSYVSISGKGKIIGDSLFYEYFSGGPMGQIESQCWGSRKE